MSSTFEHQTDTATTLHKLRGMFHQRFGCLKSQFLSKLSFMATSIPRINDASLAYVSFISTFHWRLPTCLCGSRVGWSEPAKYKINWNVNIIYTSFSLSIRIRNIVLVLCKGVKRQGDKRRSKVPVGPTVFIHLNNTTTPKLQYLQFILNNGAS